MDRDPSRKGDPSAAPQSRVGVLDGWRAIAIAGVLVAHSADGALKGAHPQLHRLASFGSEGVSLFFGISGFIITLRLLSESARKGHFSLRSFYVRRAFRILPPLLAFLFVLAILSKLLGLGVGEEEFASSLFFFRNYLPGHVARTWYTGHIWSLCVEEHFYVIWPALLAWAGRKRGIRLALALCVAVALWRTLAFRLHPLQHWLPGVEFFIRTDLRLDALLWGCVLALVWHRLSKGGPLATPMLRLWPAGLVLYAACLLYPVPQSVAIRAAVVPWMICGSLFNSQGRIERFLGSGPLTWVGRISYSIYLWQQLFLTAAGIPRVPGLSAFQQWPWNILVVIALACASYYGIELPFIAMGRRLSERISGRGQLGSAKAETGVATLGTGG